MTKNIILQHKKIRNQHKIAQFSTKFSTKYQKILCLCKHSKIIGDDASSVAWWDDIVDGAVYKKLQGCPNMHEGDTAGIMLRPAKRVAELYLNRAFIASFTSS